MNIFTVNLAAPPAGAPVVGQGGCPAICGTWFSASPSFRPASKFLDRFKDLPPAATLPFLPHPSPSYNDGRAYRHERAWKWNLALAISRSEF